MIELTNRPESQPGTGFYRTLVVVEVLSDRPIEGMSLAEIGHEITDGESSGLVEILDAREIGKRDMARYLQDQDSDPEYLLGEDAWKYVLYAGDEVTWNDPDHNTCTRTFVIRTVKYKSDDVVVLTDENGSVVECPITELS